MFKYEKREGNLTLATVGQADDSGRKAFDLRVTLGDTPLEDGFWISIPWDASSLSFGDLLNDVFPDDEAKQDGVLASLDGRANPDLPDMYVGLLDVFDDWRGGNRTLNLFVNHGPEVQFYERVQSHIKARLDQSGLIVGSAVLDVVIEQHFEVIKKYQEWGGDRQDLIQWLSGATLLYFMDKHGYQPTADQSEDTDSHLEPVFDDMRSRDLIAEGQGTGRYEITESGRGFLGHLIAETESYIRHYDVFKDVLYDVDAGLVEFDTGLGDDLRVQVYDEEGLDLIRVVFLLRMYDGTLDEYTDSWTEAINSDEFFDEILSPVLDHEFVDADLIEWIIESGRNFQEEQAEEARDQAIQRTTLRRLE